MLSLMGGSSSHSQTHQVVWDDLRERLENLELVTPGLRPEHEVCFDRRAARIGTGELRYHDGFSIAEIEMLARPGTNAFLLGRDAGAFLRQANIQQKTQRLKRLVVGVDAVLIATIIVFAHRQQEAGAKNVALTLAFELPALFAVVDLRAFYSGVAVDINRSVVLVAVGFGLGCHPRERWQQAPVQKLVDVLPALAVGNGAQHDRQPVGNLTGARFESLGAIGFLEAEQKGAAFVVLAEQLITHIRMADRVQIKKAA